MVSRRSFLTGTAGLLTTLAYESALPQGQSGQSQGIVNPSLPVQRGPEQQGFLGGKIKEYRGDGLLGPEMGLVDYLALQGSSVALVAFGFAACFPCLEEKPFLNALRDKYQEEGLSVVGVEIQAEWYLTTRDAEVMFSNLAEFAHANLAKDEVGSKEYVARYPILGWFDDRDPPVIYGAKLGKFKRDSYPQVYLLPENGNEVRRGNLRVDNLARLLRNQQGQRRLESMIEQALSSQRKRIHSP
ncbi:hypothetical protein HYS47_03680 [Candidatus Woesearchaeota archaeon]|nr:hypothetical protein [Candidatus Woesearchaeota archaeon]